MTVTRLALCGGALLSLLGGGTGGAGAEPSGPPNVVLILADDVAFSDFGAYGSEISTPTIDALAERGVRFANFHASPMCAPSRAMLMTGVSSHRAGVANLPETTPAEFRGAPAYRGRLATNVETIASRLQKVGYATYMTGKWHLGHTPETLPSARGFDRTFIFDATGADNWEDRPYLPIYDDANWYADGVPADLPEDFYSSRFLVDRMIELIGAGGEQPFFAYVAFQAVHIPVQAPREFTARYDGVYDRGWEPLRRARHQGAVRRGVVARGIPIRPIHPALRDWDALAADERALLARSMAVNAGMLEAMDFHFGRLVEHLRGIGEYEDTIFIVTSDNGPEGANPGASRATMLWLELSGYTRELENLGERGSFVFIGPEFASAAASPHALFKFYAGEGGLRVPLIVAGPGVERGRIAHGFSFITDLPATIAELAGARTDGMTGRSLVPVLGGGADGIYREDEVVGVEAAGHAALFRGPLKLVRNRPPLGDGVWRLYDLSVDPGETRDLAAAEPASFGQMRESYAAWALENGVLEVPRDYTPLAEIRRRLLGRAAVRYGWVVGLVVLLGLLASYLVYQLARRRTA